MPGVTAFQDDRVPVPILLETAQRQQRDEVSACKCSCGVVAQPE